jgi:hypothetical protein
MAKVDFQAGRDALKPVEPGLYPGKLSAFTYHAHPKDKPEGNAFYTLEYEITQGEGEGKKVWRNYTLSLTALPYLERDLVTLGADPDELLASEVELDDVIKPLLNAECGLKLDIKVVNGQETQNLAGIVDASEVDWTANE